MQVFVKNHITNDQQPVSGQPIHIGQQPISIKKSSHTITRSLL
jgi:hypothetical protein